MKYLLMMFFPIAVSAQHLNLDKWDSKQGSQYPALKANRDTMVVGMSKGAYMTYSLSLAPGEYDIFINAATPQNNVRVTINADTVAIPNTGGWDIWSTVKKRIKIPDTKVVKFTLISTEQANFDWLEYYVDFVIVPPMSDTTYCTKYEYDSLGFIRTRPAKFIIVKRDKPAIYYIDDKGRAVDARAYHTGKIWLNL